MKLDKTFRRALPAAALTAGLAWASAARADDFTFKVPVDVSAMTSGLGSGLVSCVALSVAPPPAPAPSGGDVIGRGAARFSLTNGSYQGTLNVHFNALPGKRLENAKGYRCELLFVQPSGKDESAAAWLHKPGTSYSDDVRGAISP
jgi:hypothetical protein